SLSFAPVLVGHAWGRRRGPAEEPLTRGMIQALAPAHWWVAIAALLTGAGVWIGILEPRERARSGREAGVAIGAVVADGMQVWADHMIEARPEVLWYARQEAARRGRT